MLGRTLIIVFTFVACGTDIQAFGPDGGGGGGAQGGAASGLPCDVQTVLSNYCTSCHGNPPSGGAPMSLTSYADLVATSSLGGTIAQRAYARMTSATSPMPPGTPNSVPAAQVATYKAWLDAGMPMGSCGGSTGTDPLNAAPVCTSGQYFTGGEGSRMRPGDACIACHAQSGGEAPTYTIAGTLYPTGHEPAECNGTSGPAQIVVTDARGQVVTLTPNSVGNFSAYVSLTFPIHAKVVAGSKERAMVGAQTSGDCNTCHTPNGASLAPGRITMP